MKLKYEFSYVDIADEITAVPIAADNSFNGVIVINETMKDIMELLAKDTTEEEIVEALLEMYQDVTKEELEEKVHELCQSLDDDGLIIK